MNNEELMREEIKDWNTLYARIATLEAALDECTRERDKALKHAQYLLDIINFHLPARIKNMQKVKDDLSKARAYLSTTKPTTEKEVKP